MNLYINEDDGRILEAYQRGETAIAVTCYQYFIAADDSHDWMHCTKHQHSIDREQAATYLLNKAIQESD